MFASILFASIANYPAPFARTLSLPHPLDFLLYHATPSAPSALRKRETVTTWFLLSAFKLICAYNNVKKF